jgi:hypothetical protein
MEHTQLSEEEAESTEQKPRRAFFRPQRVRTTLSPEALNRQSEATRLAMDALGAADGIAFLNGHDEALGGRPIDLAMADAEGLAAVGAALLERRQR